MKTFKTPEGTELQLISLKGKDYLPVAQRLIWFNETWSDWSIQTEFVQITDKMAIAKATIKDGKDRIMATAHKQETAAGFGDYIEKAETGAIGRALALIGFGTQFTAHELDEGERIVDAPVASAGSRYLPQMNDLGPMNDTAQDFTDSMGAEVVSHTKINKNTNAEECPQCGGKALISKYGGLYCSNYKETGCKWKSK